METLRIVINILEENKKWKIAIEQTLLDEIKWFVFL